jgi:probable F420-dependent oxidoreductase
VAKQASIVDVLSRGRLRLGVGTGWNPVEYEALGENFHNRGRRSEEQVAVLRALWTRELVTFEGRWHTIRDAGMCPLPVQRPIPIWFGGRADAVLERCGRLGDGWIQLYFKSDDPCRRQIDAIREAARGAGRDPMAIGLESWVSLGGLTPDDWAREAAAWRALGMTHLTVNTEFTGLHHLASDVHGVEEHVALLRRYKDAVGDLA